MPQGFDQGACLGYKEGSLMKCGPRLQVTAFIAVVFIPAILLIGCTHENTRGNANPSKTTHITNQTIQASALPPQFLKPVSSSISGATNDLRDGYSLILDGTTLTVGQVGGHQTLTLAANTLEILNSQTRCGSTILEASIHFLELIKRQNSTRRD
jgi:hypothetical protein